MSEATRRGIRHWVTESESALYALVFVVTSALTVVALKLWDARLDVPFLYRGDALPTGAHFKTVIETGWYEYQPALGAPVGQTYHDFPTADNLHMIAARIIGFFVPDWAVVINVYFLIGFPLAAVTALWFLRVCGVSRLLSVTLATLFALASYHFIRGESHLFLASYYAIPLALVLLVHVLRGQPLWGYGARSGWKRWVVSPTVRTLLIVGLLATSSSYYSVFFLILIAAAGIFAFIRDRSWHRFFGAAAVGLATVGFMLVNMAPDLIHTAIAGANPGAVERAPGEAEFYALKLAQLLLPWSGHRIPILAELRGQYDSSYVSLGEQPSLGIVAASGLVAAFLILPAIVIGRMRAEAKRPSDRTLLVFGLSALVFVAFLFSTLGGLSTLISVFTSSLRGWNRMSIVIMMLCLAIIGLLIDQARERISRPRLARPATAIIAIGLLVVGFIDQTPGNSDAEYAGNAIAFDSDQQFVDAVEDVLPADSMVLMLPYVPFPESSSPTGSLASDELVPYLHSTDLRWSVGGIKGRPTSDWSGQLEQYGEGSVARLGVIAGFAGVVIDRNASLDRGAALEEALGAQIATPPIVSSDDRFAFYDLTEVATELGVAPGVPTDDAALVTDPVVAYPNPDFLPDFAPDGRLIVSAEDPGSRITIANDGDEAREIILSLTVYADGGADRLAITLPDGRVVKRTIDVAGTVVTARFEAQPGLTTASLVLTDAAGNFASTMLMEQPEALNLDVQALVR
jgi:phosphoglycerol transferase